MATMTAGRPAVKVRGGGKPRRPRAEVRRVAAMRRDIRRAREVWVWAGGRGFVRVPKSEALSLVRRRGGELVGRFTAGLDVMRLEPCPF